MDLKSRRDLGCIVRDRVIFGNNPRDLLRRDKDERSLQDDKCAISQGQAMWSTFACAWVTHIIARLLS